MKGLGQHSLRIMLGLGVCLPAIIAPAWAQEAASDAATGDEIIVTGSRIPTIRDQGPSPVTTIDADTIRANGYTSVPELLAAMTQNSGETQSPQSGSSSDFTPGAQQVDLRGLGPNHTLVLINGRRIADFPLPYIGRSNFTDISNIPVSLIEKVEILSGAASAIYGSDAIAGVVNFKMKEKLDGITLDYRHGRTEHGGGMSHRVTATGGWSTDRFSISGGVEYLDQRPLWAFQRNIQDSTDDNPVNTVARRTFVRADENVDYIAPPAGACDALSNLNFGSVKLYNRPRYGDFCGSKESIAYGTIISGRKGFNSFGTMSYELSDNAKLFTDFQFGISKVKLMYDVTSWAFEQSSSSADNNFFNSFTGQVEDWGRQFTPEETGGFEMQRSKQTTYSITPGVRGNFADSWNYELSFNYSRYKSIVRWPQIINSKAQALFLGEQMGIDPDSNYPIYNADPARLYRPLTRAEYDSISADTVYKPVSWTSNLQATLSNGELLQLPAGPVGIAVVAEYGKQGYNLHPDPLALTDYYFSWKDSDGQGKRSHAALGGEVRVPVLDFVTVTGAARYDRFSFAGRDVGKFTYNGGLEVRPLNSLLFRAAYGTAFRAPDLHYVFTGPGNVEGSVDDYLYCRQNEPGVEIEDCERSGEGVVLNRNGNRDLKPETGRSLTAGAVFSPSSRLHVSVDYFRVTLDNQVDDLRARELVRTEADCTIGTTESGATVDRNSPTCVDALARVQRFDGGARDGRLESIRINPINIAREKTSGIDVAFRGTLPTSFGDFTLSLSHSHVLKHSFQQYPGDPNINKLAADSSYYLPRDKSNGSISWAADGLQLTVSGTRLGKLPNYDEDAFIKASTLFNASLQYDFTDHMRGSLTIRNLFDTNPVKDPTWSGYPYYNTSWFDSIGRSVFMQLTYKLGGSAL
ncbi:TonB-dependent receptor plug domain-containing protein [Sphingopyxis witflariensis]|uniref:TonB-dependent receptor n=1 Tax=Sphingopyxis witflariensis TaxID=173675 RepID=A0A246K344_9SPHN|nr:TonB-dependent receptor [Sphingopyxis witflariensis]OWQ99992.1 TonB-dependent receptor [Sphingopyxis witflariensis]